MAGQHLQTKIGQLYGWSSHVLPLIACKLFAFRCVSAKCGMQRWAYMSGLTLVACVQGQLLLEFTNWKRPACVVHWWMQSMQHLKADALAKGAWSAWCYWLGLHAHPQSLSRQEANKLCTVRSHIRELCHPLAPRSYCHRSSDFSQRICHQYTNPHGAVYNEWQVGSFWARQKLCLHSRQSVLVQRCLNRLTRCHPPGCHAFGCLCTETTSIVCAIVGVVITALVLQRQCYLSHLRVRFEGRFSTHVCIP